MYEFLVLRAIPFALERQQPFRRWWAGENHREPIQEEQLLQMYTAVGGLYSPWTGTASLSSSAFRSGCFGAHNPSPPGWPDCSVGYRCCWDAAYTTGHRRNESYNPPFKRRGGGGEKYIYIEPEGKEGMIPQAFSRHSSATYQLWLAADSPFCFLKPYELIFFHYLAKAASFT